MEGKIYITPKGKRKIESEIRRIKTEVRPKIVLELEDARSHGDLSENAEYHAAKERLGHIDGKIQDLEDKLTRIEIVDTSRLETSKVVFGLKVKLVNIESMEESTYRIVGDYEADPLVGEISIHSPIAKALIGKSLGDEVSVVTPGGTKSFEIIGIEK